MIDGINKEKKEETALRVHGRDGVVCELRNVDDHVGALRGGGDRVKGKNMTL